MGLIRTHPQRIPIRIRSEFRVDTPIDVILSRTGNGEHRYPNYLWWEEVFFTFEVFALVWCQLTMERNCKLVPEFYDHPSRSLVWRFSTFNAPLLSNSRFLRGPRLSRGSGVRQVGRSQKGSCTILGPSRTVACACTLACACSDLSLSFGFGRNTTKQLESVHLFLFVEMGNRPSHPAVGQQRM